MDHVRVHALLPYVWFGIGLAIAQAPGTVPQLENPASHALAERDAGGALTAYEKLAQLVPTSANYQDEIGFLQAAYDSGF